MTGQTIFESQPRGYYASRETFLPQASDAEAEAAARELWSDWDRMDGEERRVLLLEVHRALGAVAACRVRADPEKDMSRALPWPAV
jgi:hypothetical protein